MKTLVTHLFLILSLLLVSTTVLAADNMDPALHKKAKRAADKGLRYLREHQGKDGSWSHSVGITALALRAFLESHRDYNEADGAFITRPLSYIKSHVHPDGSISESAQNRNYNTAVAITALQATKNPAHHKLIKDGQKFLVALQLDESNGYDKKHRYYGGIGYGGDERPDLSNQYLALEALRATELDGKDETWDKAMAFIERCQNRSESNDQSWASNDGGFTYMPGFSPHGEAKSYGGMTHAGLVSLLFAGVDKKDPRIQSAYDWIRKNYTLEKNPGTPGYEGLFYYYQVFAKSMYALGEKTITDNKNVKHNWREDLAKKLLSLQADDGSWVNTKSGRWWENNPQLVTAWSVITLNFITRDQ